jgi:hypothetical protein
LFKRRLLQQRVEQVPPLGIRGVLGNTRAQHGLLNGWCYRRKFDLP